MGQKLMMYDGNIFARSFSRYDQKKLRYGAFLACLLVAFSFFTVFRPYLGPLPVLYTRLSMVVERDISTNQTIINENVVSSESPAVPICRFEKRTEFCEMNGDVRVDGKSSTVFMSAASTIRSGTSAMNSSWIIRPYPRRDDPPAMRHITKWSIKSGVDAYDAPQCDQTHGVPAIIFSLAGYTGNIFHDFAEVIAPLYLTCRQFDGEVKFLITNGNQRWIDKYRGVFQKLSRYESVDIDKEVNVHCFTSVTVGLKRYPEELKLNPSESPYSMSDFRQFLRSAYSLKKENAIKLRDDNGGDIERPRILILSRKRTRTFTNTDAIAGLARRLGYEVIVSEADSDIERVAEMVNSCDVLMAFHGAGLTNMLFLPDNAVLIQVLGIGGMEWAAKTDYEEPSKDMKLRYLEYKIKREESSLMQQYPADHEVLNTPDALTKLGWNAFYSIYMSKQNVTIDINRFEPTLLKALELLHQ